MLTTLEQLRSTIREVVKRSDAERVALSIANAASKVGFRVTATVDASAGMVNIFVKLATGNPEAVEPVLVTAASSLGWLLLSRSDRQGTTWWFEPGSTIKGYVSAAKLPPMLWHVTREKNVADIMRNGLVPRQRSDAGTMRRYEPRVYLATSPAMLGTANSAADLTTGWIMLRIDRSRVPKGTMFYVDQEFGHNKAGMPVAVYTLDPVPASAIMLA